MAGDTQRYDPAVNGLFLLIQALFEVCALAVLTWYLLGYQALGGFLFIVGLVIFYFIMGWVCTELRDRIAKVTDKRLNVMNAVLPGIRAIKMHAWEWSFIKMVRELRR